MKICHAEVYYTLGEMVSCTEDCHFHQGISRLLPYRGSPYTPGKQSVIQGYLFSQGIPIAIPRKMGTLGVYSPGSIYRDQGSHFPGIWGPRVPILEGPHLFSHTDIGVKGNQTPQPFCSPPPQLTVYKHLRKRRAKLASFLAS